ncbi:hypothetical protein GOBAR_DD26120 [Gossypium barbadense]|nr:hypothetical protein GOBAR_DD26120 [Gossypium barbadense]
MEQEHDMLCNMESSGAAVVGSDEIQLPRGNQVFPSDEFLADCLMKRFNGEPNPDQFHEVDLYSKHPAQLTDIYLPKPYPLTMVFRFSNIRIDDYKYMVIDQKRWNKVQTISGNIFAFRAKMPMYPAKSRASDPTG